MFIPGHIERQRQYGPTFWCGLPFCGHETIEAAVKCWNKHCDETAKMEAEFKRLEESGEGYLTAIMNKIVWLPKQ